MLDLSSSINELRNVAQIIAHKLEQMILQGELKPGEHLIQTDIAERFGVSRLPVRDALKILELRELAVTLPRRGVIVRKINYREVEDLFEFRLLLESHAFADSLTRFTAEDITDVQNIIRHQELIPDDQFLRLLEVDEQFHLKLCSRCRNEEIKSNLIHVWNRIRVLRSLARGYQNWKQESVASHRQILEAITQQDYKTARQLLEDGVRSALSRILIEVVAHEKREA